MTAFIPATLWANENLICQVNLFFEKDGYVTVASKTYQKVLFFQPNEPLTLHYQEGTVLHQKKITFHEVKMINRNPYYVFQLMKDTAVTSSVEPFSAVLSSEFENGVVSIVALQKYEVTLLHDKPLQGRYFELTFKENNVLRRFLGKAIWAKKKDNRHYYRLVSV